MSKNCCVSDMVLETEQWAKQQKALLLWDRQPSGHVLCGVPNLCPRTPTQKYRMNSRRRRTEECVRLEQRPQVFTD